MRSWSVSVRPDRGSICAPAPIDRSDSNAANPGVSPVSMDDAEAWDETLAAMGASPLQSWAWGELKRRHGWSVERIGFDAEWGSARAQVLFRSRGPVSLAYVPRGPMLSGDRERIFRALVGHLDRVCRRRRAISLIVEPDRPLGLGGTYRTYGFVRGPAPFQPERTVRVPLLPDGQLVAQMHSKNRYSIRPGRPARRRDRTWYDRWRPGRVLRAATRDVRAQWVRHPCVRLLCRRLSHVRRRCLPALREGRREDRRDGDGGPVRPAGRVSLWRVIGRRSWRRRRLPAPVRPDALGARARRNVVRPLGHPVAGPPNRSRARPAPCGAMARTKAACTRSRPRFGGEIIRFPWPMERRYAPLLSVAAQRLGVVRG